MKKFLFLLLAVTAGTAPAQTLVYPGEHEMPPVPKTFDNELGVRYGAQLYVGDGRGPELQAFSIDYARYNFYNIGFRTGLNVFVDEDAENYFSVPLQFTWRTGRIASSWRRESRERSVQNNYYNGSYADPYGAYSGGGADVGSTFLNVLLAILPSGFEVHAGFTPGLMCVHDRRLFDDRPFVAALYRPAAFLLYVRRGCAADHPDLAVQPLRRLHLSLLPDR